MKIALLDKLSRRYNPLYFYLTKPNTRKWVSFTEVVQFMFGSTCEQYAPKFSNKVDEDADYIYYKIKNLDDIFCYPKQASYHHFAQVVTEGMNRNHWHYYEIPETIVTSDDIVVDCGSAEGFFAFKYQNIAKKIYAVEPLPLFVATLEKLFVHNHKVEILPIALGNHESSLFMQPNSIGSICKTEITKEEEPFFIKVNSTTIDAEFAEKNIPITYIKADLEGFEENMILGALKTIKINKPKIAITTYHKGQDFQKLIDIIQNVVPEYDYKVKGIESIEGKPVMLHLWCN